MDEVFNFYFYSRHFLKIRPKVGDIIPFQLRRYQKRFMNFWDDLEKKGPVRIVVLKPRQAGFSTLVAGKFSHEMMTNYFYQGILLADKLARTNEVAGIYKCFIENLPTPLLPMVKTYNTEQILFANPDEMSSQKGLRSGIKFETANDPNAGRSGTRQFAHWTEVAFCNYCSDIDDGIQNSIPLVHGTSIVKESTANGMSGKGKYFYDLYNAAKRGESAYKSFFVAWHEVDDYYIITKKLEPTKYEKYISEKYGINQHQLAWRRLKLLEYLDDSSNMILTPEERFKQDFPLDDREAFLSTGQPVFPAEQMSSIIDALEESRPNQIQERLKIEGTLMNQRKRELKIFSPPRPKRQYFIGADVSEGLPEGDASSLCVIDEDGRQMATWHGKIDPDMYGHLLIEIGEYYNTALICPEKNNMGHTTVTTIKNEGYPKLYKYVVEDKIKKEKMTKYGWTTNEKTKAQMLNETIKALREDLTILDVETAREMAGIARKEGGKVVLNSKDRTVALCLACVARRQMINKVEKPPRPNMETGTAEEIRIQFEKTRSKAWY